MQSTSLRTARLLCVWSVIALLTSVSVSGAGQLNSNPAGVALIARLESLSIAVAAADDVGVTPRRNANLHHASIRLTTSWTVPSNLTTVRVVENGTPLFSQSIGEANQPGRRVDQLEVVPGSEKFGRTNPDNQRTKIIIFVQAL